MRHGEIPEAVTSEQNLHQRVHANRSLVRVPNGTLTSIYVPIESKMYASGPEVGSKAWGETSVGPRAGTVEYWHG